MIPDASRRVRLNRVTPQFLVRDLDRASSFYRDGLGFEVTFRYADFYAGVERDGQMIHLKLWDEPDPSREFKRRHEHLDAYFEVTDVEALYEEIRGRGVSPLKPLHATPWRTREFALQDPDGYLLYFGQSL